MAGVSFWRPRAPEGFSLLGDCVTNGTRPPAREVLAVASTCGLLAAPLGFRCLWWGNKGEPPEGEADWREDARPSDAVNLAPGHQTPSIWLPIPPEGFQAVGCVVHMGEGEPVGSSVRCIRAEVLTTAALGECLALQGPLRDPLPITPPTTPRQDPSQVRLPGKRTGSFLVR